MLRDAFLVPGEGVEHVAASLEKAPAPAGTFSISAADEDGPPTERSLRVERRAFARRLHDLAIGSMLDARPVLVAAVLASTLPLAICEWFLIDAPVQFRPLPAVLAAALALATLAWPAVGRRRAQDGPRDDRRLALLGALIWLMLASLVWLVPPGAPFSRTFSTVAILSSSLLALALLAPSAAASRAAALLPCSAAMANLLRPEVTSQALGVACLALSMVALALARRQHRLWVSNAHVTLQQVDRIRALELARDAAVKADQEKSRFLAIASHDLRQPVHAIGLFAATLAKRLEGSAEEPLVRNMSRAIDGLDRSFNVMLDISRLDAGAIEPRVKQFPVRDLFRRLHMHFAGHAEQKGLGLRFSPGGKSVSSDPQLLERVLSNLVQNAIKYTEKGGIVVVVRSTATHHHLEVWDTGLGIRAQDLPKVFEEYYQVGQRERVRSQGLGMGLAIVKRLVRLLGHELEVASRPGKGTMFRLKIALGGLPGLPDMTAGADTLPMPLDQARSVLVLDDEEPIREGLCLLLQEWGFEAQAAASIEEAVRAVRRMEAPPDLIISDLHLGDGPDGIEGIEAIRRECGMDLAAMLITGDTTAAEMRRATDSGHPVLFKPVQPRKLFDALRGMVH